MGVGSLYQECLQLGIPVDFANLTRESEGLTGDQVLELCLEKLLHTKKLEMTEERRTTEVLDLQKQLEQLSKKLEEKEDKITSQNDEIKTLKEEIQKIRKDSGVPRLEEERSEAEGESYDTFDWGKGQIALPRGSHRVEDDGEDLPQQNGLTLKESEAQKQCEGQVIVNRPASTSGTVERNIHPPFLRLSRIDHVTGNRNANEDIEISEISEDDEKNEDERSPESDGIQIPGSQRNSAQPLPPRRRPAHLSNIRSDISSPPASQNICEQPGSSRVPKTTSRKLISCKRCPKVYKHQRALQMHIFSVHSKDPGVFKCERCRSGYFSMTELRLHNDRCDPSQSWSCSWCSVVFKSKPLLYHHQRMHVGENGEFEEARCDICQKTFGNVYALRDHKKQKHSQAKKCLPKN